MSREGVWNCGLILVLLCDSTVSASVCRFVDFDMVW